LEVRAIARSTAVATTVATSLCDTIGGMKVKKAKPKPKQTAKRAAPVATAAPTPKARASTRLSVNGKTVVITGTVPGMQRKEAEAKLVALGARCTGTVSKQTDYVFAMDDAGAKRGEAAALGIPILGEAVLFSLIGLPGKPRAPAAQVTAEAKAKVAERKAEPAVGFAGKTVVITGTLSMQRSDVAALLEGAGAKVVGSVSANTHFLITGAGVGASKLSKATALGVTLIDEPTMREMLEE
jgi:NAD-dependent DNA ligase